SRMLMPSRWARRIWPYWSTVSILASVPPILQDKGGSRTETAGVGPFYLPIRKLQVGPFCTPITTGFTPEGEANGGVGLAQTVGAAGAGLLGQGRQALSEDGAGAVRCRTEEAPRGQAELDDATVTGQVRQRSLVAAVDTGGDAVAYRARSELGDDLEVQGDGLAAEVNTLKGKARGSREEVKRWQRLPPERAEGSRGELLPLL